MHLLIVVIIVRYSPGGVAQLAMKIESVVMAAIVVVMVAASVTGGDTCLLHLVSTVTIHLRGMNN